MSGITRIFNGTGKYSDFSQDKFPTPARRSLQHFAHYRKNPGNEEFINRIFSIVSSYRKNLKKTTRKIKPEDK